MPNKSKSSLAVFVVALSAIDGVAMVKKMDKLAAQGLGMAQVTSDPASPDTPAAWDRCCDKLPGCTATTD